MTPQQILLNLRLVSTILETIASDQNFQAIASNPESDPGLATHIEDARHYVYEARSYFEPYPAQPGQSSSQVINRKFRLVGRSLKRIH